MSLKPSKGKALDKKKDDQNESDAAAIGTGGIMVRRRYDRRAGDPPGPSIWLISFTDVMALMLTFFVLLFAMSNPKQEDWEDFTDTLQNNFNKYYGQPLNRGIQDAISIEKVDFSRALDLSYLKTLIVSLTKQEESLKDIELYPQPGRLIVSLPEDLLFEPGSDALGDGSTRALFTLAEMLGRIKNRVEIVGHADPRPVRTERFSSNWDLSFARAAQVSAALARYGYTRPVRVRAQASGRYGDLADKLPEAERLSLSRRVDIIIMEDDGKRLKFFDLSMP